MNHEDWHLQIIGEYCHLRITAKYLVGSYHDHYHHVDACTGLVLYNHPNLPQPHSVTTCSLNFQHNRPSI